MAGKTDDGAKVGLANFIIPFAIVTILGGSGGAFLGASLLPALFKPTPTADGGAEAEAPPSRSDKSAANAHGPSHVEKHEKAGAGAPTPPALAIRELPPIVTNLTGVGRPLIRLQSAVVYDPEKLPHADPLLASLRSDIVSFLATLELFSIEGPDGLRRLQEELRERAATRSEGRIRDVIIETLVIQ
ncbi:flagellar basal body-associated FliL family protein [Methylocystis parvus]|uniref:flagellar basal body-associated FliL family protein n=1 Tax=Methylocystis parvus TaxID=134 RepID=UPI003C75BFD4